MDDEGATCAPGNVDISELDFRRAAIAGWSRALSYVREKTSGFEPTCGIF